MIVAGIDAGSRTVKVVLFDADRRRVAAAGLRDQGLAQGRIAARLLAEVLRKAHLARRQIRRIVATGYGRESMETADAAITEITCHARGVKFGCPGARTVIDMGGQDSKLIRVGADGKVRDFVMNDRCAAGTGRFLEVLASRFGVDMEGLGRLVRRARRPVAINSTCVVFAETEIVGLIAGGEKPENIVAGVQASMASRLLAMAGRRLDGPLVFTGGVALVPGLARALAKAFEHPVRVARNPRFTGALGAALLAAEQ
jgi:predicted CoA-substrate-specific enzyme activase